MLAGNTVGEEAAVLVNETLKVSSLSVCPGFVYTTAGDGSRRRGPVDAKAEEVDAARCSRRYSATARCSRACAERDVSSATAR